MAWPTTFLTITAGDADGWMVSELPGVIGACVCMLYILLWYEGGSKLFESFICNLIHMYYCLQVYSTRF